MNRIFIINLICIMLVSVSTGVNAEVYKWVDEHGRIHYGEKPPVDDASKIEIKESPGTEDIVKKPGIDRDKLLEIYEEERRQKKEEKLKAEKEKKELMKRCASLKNEIGDMKQGGISYYDLDKNGERKYLSEKDIESHIKNLEKEYKQYCK